MANGKVYMVTQNAQLVALDATLRVRGPEGERELPVEELYRLPGDTPHLEHSLLPQELIVQQTQNLLGCVALPRHAAQDRHGHGHGGGEPDQLPARLPHLPRSVGQRH